MLVGVSDYPDGVSEPLEQTDAPDLEGTPAAIPPRGLAGSVLAIPVFRHLWAALSLASMGDWLGLLALTAYAQLLTDGYTKANLAVAVVFLLKLSPTIVLGPIAGVVADRVDRRLTMVFANGIRFVLIASIPLVHQLWWVFAATFLVECASLFFIPAKEATVPNLVPRERLEAANQLNLAGTYGSAPVAALLFVGLSLVGRMLGDRHGVRGPELALYVNAATFLIAAVVIARLHDLPTRRVVHEGDTPPESPMKALVDGWRYVGTTPIIRGIVVAMLGAFAAGGAVIGLARTYVHELGGGDAAYGVLFAAVFIGMATGMGIGPRLVTGFSRGRLLGLTICGAGLSLALLAIVPNLAIGVVLTVFIGSFAGLSWVTGYTLLGLEVADEVRGRVFATLQLFVRVVLIAILAVAPLLAGAIGRHALGPDSWRFTLSGASITLLVAGLFAAALGVVSYRAMDDRAGMPLAPDVVAVMRGAALPVAPTAPTSGFFLVLEGGEGSGKTTLAQRLATAIRARGHEVVLTHEPGATPVGARLRAMLLNPTTGGIDSRTEALLYAADRAEHVATVIRPALERGAVVISDRYVDSSIAYQGAGRSLHRDEIAWLSSWASQGLTPSLTALLDVPPLLGLARAGSTPDRLEAEPREFHERVRREFLTLARTGGERYVVVDATQDPDTVARQVVERLRQMVPASPRELAEREARRKVQERADREAREQAEREARRLAREQADRDEAAQQAHQERERLQRERARQQAAAGAAAQSAQRAVEVAAAEQARAQRQRSDDLREQQRRAAALADDTTTTAAVPVDVSNDGRRIPANDETTVLRRADLDAARPPVRAKPARLRRRHEDEPDDQPADTTGRDVDLTQARSLADDLLGWGSDRSSSTRGSDGSGHG